jgi:hypothetical protein
VATILAVSVWLYVIGFVATQGEPVSCGNPAGDRLIALIPALLAFAGALATAWWNRPDRDGDDGEVRPRRRVAKRTPRRR